MERKLLMRFCVSLFTATIIMFTSTLAFANSKPFSTPFFTINLPDEIVLVNKSKNTNPDMHRYLFSSLPESPYSNQQLKVAVVGQIPETILKSESFEINVLASYALNFMDVYHLYQYLDDPAIRKVLRQPAQSVKLGNETFKSVALPFDRIQAQFLILIKNKTLYVLTLTSINDNKSIRMKNMQQLTNIVKSIRFK